MKIEILTGSHQIVEKHNKELFSKIEEILLNKKNPLFQKFNKEDLFLDDTNEFIGIVSNSWTKEITKKQFNLLKDYLLLHIKAGDFYLYVQAQCSKFN